MAKQIAGLCRLEGTFDQITFYKMEGQYYARKKSSLTSERVKTSDQFRLTMACANLLVRASKIGSAIYKALPPGWRQFWMYRAFTGEAFTLLDKNPYTDQQVTQILWQCYVEYWEQIKATDSDNPIWQPKPAKIRKRRVYSLESLLRKKDKYGKPYLRDPEAEEQKRLALENKRAWSRQQLEKERLLAIEQTLAKEIPAETQQPKKEIQPVIKPAISSWRITNDGTIQTIEKPTKPLHTYEACNST